MKSRIINIVAFLLTVSFWTEAQYFTKEFEDFSREFPLPVPVEHSLLTRWAGKEIKDSLLIDDMEGKRQWSMNVRYGRLNGIGTLGYTEERAIDGKRSLRYQTALRDTAHLMLPQNRTRWGSFSGRHGGLNRFGITFDEPQDWSEYNRIAIWVYIQPTANPTHQFTIEIITEGADNNTLSPRYNSFVHDIEAGSWRRVYLEIPHLERSKVEQFSISHLLTGFNSPEGENPAIFDFDRLMLQKVDADNYEGWAVPAGKFAFSHVGYRPHDPKIALTGETTNKKFQLINQDNKVEYKGVVEVIENKNGIFHQLDFSEFRKEGVYRLQCGASVSDPFPINLNIWLNPLFSAINFYFCQRCGFAVPDIHGVCHLDWQGFYGDEKKVINGGWHDAGDLSQGHWRTATATYVLMRHLELVQQDKTLKHLAAKLQDEAVWGLKWLLKTRFADGHHIMWSTMRMYTDNVTGTIDDVVEPARNVPWENFLGAAIECKASQLFENDYLELSEEALISAVEDWQAAIASREIWDRASYKEASWGAISSILLYRMTGNNEYAKYAFLFGNLLLQCQEQSFQDRIPITGYFYTDTDRTKIIHNDHEAFDEAPMLALKELCMAFPEHENWIDWYSSAVMYSEFFIKRGSKISAPFYLVPNSVFRKSDILADTDAHRRKYNLIQFNDGTALNDEYTLRTFPIWHSFSRHGGTNTQLSTTWALAEVSLLRNDTEGMQLVGKQLEWVFGRNPFVQSLMYGVGYNFAPQYAYCTKNAVGSIPVGIDCLRHDAPYWDALTYANAKEMWIEPVNRFMGTVAAYTENRIYSERKTADNVHVEIKKLQSNEGQKAVLTIKGTGNHSIDIKAFNATTNILNQSVTLSKGKHETVELDITVLNKSKPYVIAIIIDGKLSKEIIEVHSSQNNIIKI